MGIKIRVCSSSSSVVVVVVVVGAGIIPPRRFTTGFLVGIGQAQRVKVVVFLSGGFAGACRAAVLCLL